MPGTQRTSGADSSTSRPQDDQVRASEDQPRAAEGIPKEHRGDVERLLKMEQEADQLRTKLAEEGIVAAAAPHEPSFGMSQGTKEELERTGRATDPFTGKRLTRDDLPRDDLKK